MPVKGEYSDRLLAYARKALGWEERLDGIRDARRRPQIPGARIIRAAVVMFLCRLGSLNALFQRPGWL